MIYIRTKETYKTLTWSFQMEMEEKEVTVEMVMGVHLSFTYRQTSSTQLLQLTQVVLAAVLTQETEGHRGWPPQPHGPPSAHPEPSATP